LEGLVTIGAGGERADANALVLGASDQEGGDIIVYSDAAGAIQFHVDADDGVGIGGAQVAWTELNVLVPATDLFGVNVDRITNPWSLTGTFGYGLACSIQSTDVATATHDTIYGFGGGFLQYRTQTGGGIIRSYGILGSGVDYRGWTGGSALRYLYGVHFTTVYTGTQASGFQTPTLYEHGAYILSNCFPTINVGMPPIGGLTAYNYGAYIIVNTNPVITTGSFTGNTYGAHITATGTTEGTQTVYGVYAKATGGDTNWALYATGAPSIFTDKVCFTQTDGNEYIDSLADGYLDIGATTGIRLRAPTSIGDGGTTNYAEFKADGELVLHGTARVIKCLNIEPKWTKGHGANPPNETTEDNANYFFVTHDYDDTTEESTYYMFQTNHDYAPAGVVHIHFDFFVDTAPASAESVCFGVEYKKVTAGTDTFDFSSGTSTVYMSESITTGTPANDKLIHQTAAIVLTTTGWEPNDIIMLRFFRDATGAGGTDDFTGDIRVFNYHLEYLSDVIGEAT